MKIVFQISFFIISLTSVHAKPIKGRRGFCQLYENIKNKIDSYHTLNDAVEEIKNAMIEGFASDIHCYDIKVYLPDLQVCHQRVPSLRYNMKWKFVKIVDTCAYKNAERFITNINCRAAWLFNPHNKGYHPHFGSFSCFNETGTRQEIILSPSIPIDFDVNAPVKVKEPSKDGSTKSDDSGLNKDTVPLTVDETFTALNETNIGLDKPEYKKEDDIKVQADDNNEYLEKIMEPEEHKGTSKKYTTHSLNYNESILSSETPDSKENFEHTTSIADSITMTGYTETNKHVAPITERDSVTDTATTINTSDEFTINKDETSPIEMSTSLINSPIDQNFVGEYFSTVYDTLAPIVDNTSDNISEEKDELNRTAYENDVTINQGEDRTEFPEKITKSLEDNGVTKKYTTTSLYEGEPTWNFNTTNTVQDIEDITATFNSNATSGYKEVDGMQTDRASPKEEELGTDSTMELNNSGESIIKTNGTDLDNSINTGENSTTNDTGIPTIADDHLIKPFDKPLDIINESDDGVIIKDCINVTVDDDTLILEEAAHPLEGKGVTKKDTTNSFNENKPFLSNESSDTTQNVEDSKRIADSSQQNGYTEENERENILNEPDYLIQPNAIEQTIIDQAIIEDEVEHEHQDMTTSRMDLDGKIITGDDGTSNDNSITEETNLNTPYDKAPLLDKSLDNYEEIENAENKTVYEKNDTHVEVNNNTELLKEIKESIEDKGVTNNFTDSLNENEPFLGTDSKILSQQSQEKAEAVSEINEPPFNTYRGSYDPFNDELHNEQLVDSVKKETSSNTNNKLTDAELLELKLRALNNQILDIKSRLELLKDTLRSHNRNPGLKNHGYSRETHLHSPETQLYSHISRH